MVFHFWSLWFCYNCQEPRRPCPIAICSTVWVLIFSALRAYWFLSKNSDHAALKYWSIIIVYKFIRRAELNLVYLINIDSSSKFYICVGSHYKISYLIWYRSSGSIFPNHSCWFCWFQQPTCAISTSQRLAFALGCWNVTCWVLIPVSWGILWCTVWVKS